MPPASVSHCPTAPSSWNIRCRCLCGGRCGRMFAVLDACTAVPQFQQPSWLHYQHSIKFCLDIQQNGVKQKFNLLSCLALDGPGVDGPAACAGRADATSAETGLLALRLRVEWGGLVRGGAGVGASERGGSSWLVHVAGARDCDQDRIRFSDRLHPCFPLLHWKHARSSFLAQDSI